MELGLEMMRKWLQKEPVKLGLASIAIAAIRVCMSSFTPVLAAAQTYGENHVNFTDYSAFSKFCGSVTTSVIAGASLLVQGKKQFMVKAPLYVYAVIATAAAVAIGAEYKASDSNSARLVLLLFKLKHGVGEEWNLSWQCLIVFMVMALQILMLRRNFRGSDWLVSGLFVCGCFVSASPWLSAKTGDNATPWYLAIGGTFVAIVYLGTEGLNQAYQDKLFCDLGTAITEQVFFISLFASVIRFIGFLWESRCIEAVVFHAKHPLSFMSVLLLSFMGAAMIYLMSYMLRLCGALICVMIHQIMVNALAGNSQKFSITDHVLKWVGILSMFGLLVITMWKMKHDHHRVNKIQLTDVDLEELDGPEFDDELLLSGLQSGHKSDNQRETP